MPILNTSIAYRHIVTFSLTILIFAGIGELIHHYPWTGLVWAGLLVILLFLWSIPRHSDSRMTIIDQLSFAQLFLLVSHTWFVMFGNTVSTIGITFLVLILLTLSFSATTVRLCTVELIAIILFEFNILQPGLLGIHTGDSLIIALTLGLAGFLLAGRSRPESDTAPAEDPVIHLPDEEFVGIETGDPDIQHADRLTILEENSRDTMSRIHQILERVYDILQPFTAMYFGLHRNLGYLTPLTIVGDVDMIDHDCTIDIGSGPIGWAAKNGMHFHWTRSSGEGDPIYYRKRAGVKSLLATPVADEHMLSGVLVVDSITADAFSAKDEKVLKVFSSQIALMFQIQKLALDKHLEASRFKLLHEVGNRLIKTLNLEELLKDILDQLEEILSMHCGIVLLFNDKTDKLDIVSSRGLPDDAEASRSFDLQEGLLGWVYQNQEEPMFFSDIRKLIADQPLLGYGEPDIAGVSIYYIPLLSSRLPIGMIVVTSLEDRSSKDVSGKLLPILANAYSLGISNARMYQQLEEQAVTDGLTRLFNHRRFQVILVEEFKRLERDPRPLSLIMLDIDHFKKFNDTYGHPVGDQVLRTVAGILRQSCRDIDVVARYGGEEFAVLLVNTDKDGAMLMAERIRQTIAGETLIVDDHRLTITVSLGVASIPEDCTERASLVDLADQALYLAKKSGRNRVMRADQLDSVHEREKQ